MDDATKDVTPARLEELLAAATPGPWTARTKRTGHVWGVDDSMGRTPRPGVVQVAEVGSYRDKELLPWCKERWDADKALIALSPSLAARVIELEAEVERLRESLRALASRAERAETLNKEAGEVLERVGLALDSDWEMMCEGEWHGSVVPAVEAARALAAKLKGEG